MCWIFVSIIRRIIIYREKLIVFHTLSTLKTKWVEQIQSCRSFNKSNSIANHFWQQYFNWMSSWQWKTKSTDSSNSTEIFKYEFYAFGKFCKKIMFFLLFPNTASKRKEWRCRRRTKVKIMKMSSTCWHHSCYCCYLRWQHKMEFFCTIFRLFLSNFRTIVFILRHFTLISSALPLLIPLLPLYRQFIHKIADAG